MLWFVGILAVLEFVKAVLEHFRPDFVFEQPRLHNNFLLGMVCFGHKLWILGYLNEMLAQWPLAKGPESSLCKRKPILFLNIFPHYEVNLIIWIGVRSNQLTQWHEIIGSQNLYMIKNFIGGGGGGQGW